MADEHSITKNPVFQNIGRPFSELFELLPRLQRKSLMSNDLSYSTDTPTLQAICQHVDDVETILIVAIQSLGLLLATAADNQVMGLPMGEVSSIGWLFQLLGDILNGCNGIKANVYEELIKRDATN